MPGVPAIPKAAFKRRPLFCKLQAMIQQRLEESQLMERYRIASDEELLLLANAPEQLTEEAQEVLAAELRDRGVRLPHLPGTAAVANAKARHPDLPLGEQQLWLKRPGDYAEVAPEECVWQFESDEALDTACTLLALEGIPTDAFSWGHAQLDMRGPRLAVLPQDRKRTAQLLAQPVPDSALEQIRLEEEAEEWSLAPCPRCGAPDPLLTSVDPQNHWRCEECRQTWVDAEAQP